MFKNKKRYIFMTINRYINIAKRKLSAICTYPDEQKIIMWLCLIWQVFLWCIKLYFDSKPRNTINDCWIFWNLNQDANNKKPLNCSIIMVKMIIYVIKTIVSTSIITFQKTCSKWMKSQLNSKSIEFLLIMLSETESKDNVSHNENYKYCEIKLFFFNSYVTFPTLNSYEIKMPIHKRYSFELEIVLYFAQNLKFFLLESSQKMHWSEYNLWSFILISYIISRSLTIRKTFLNSVFTDLDIYLPDQYHDHNLNATWTSGCSII